MHAAIAIVATNHPDYRDPVIVIGGVMSHFFYTVPMVRVTKHKLALAL